MKIINGTGVKFYLSLLWVCAGAFAQNYQTLYVGGLNVVDEGERRFSQQDLEREVLSSVENERFFRLVSLNKINDFKSNFIDDKAVAPIQTEVLQNARKLLEVGKRLYYELNFNKAEESLLLSKKIFIENLQDLRSNKDLLESHLYLGMTLLEQKKQKDAYSEFKKVAYLDPNFSMNPTQYSPDVISVFKTAQSEVKAKTLSQVTVEAPEKDMNVYVNGRLMGKTPVTLELYAGDYFFLLEKPGFHSWYKLEKVKRQNQTLSGESQPYVDQKQWGYMFRTREGVAQKSEDMKMLVDQAHQQNADYILLCGLEKNINYRLLGQIYDMKKKTFSQVLLFNVEANLGDFPGAVDEMIGTFKNMVMSGKKNLQLGVGAFGEAPAQAPTQMNQKKWYKQWWIYPVVAGVALAAIFAAQNLGGDTGGTIVINNSGN